ESSRSKEPQTIPPIEFIERPYDIGSALIQQLLVVPWDRVLEIEHYQISSRFSHCAFNILPYRRRRCEMCHLQKVLWLELDQHRFMLLEQLCVPPLRRIIYFIRHLFSQSILQFIVRTSKQRSLNSDWPTRSSMFF